MIQVTFSTDVLHYLTIIEPSVVQIKMKSNEINCANNNRFSYIMCNGPTNALLCNKTLIQMSHIKTLKITPTCSNHQMIIIRELFNPG
jgi:hypothetical protein